MPDIATVVSVVGVVLASVWGVVRYVNTQVAQLRNEASNKANVIHRRLDKIGETYMRRDEVLRHLEGIEKRLESLQRDIRDLLKKGVTQ